MEKKKMVKIVVAVVLLMAVIVAVIFGVKFIKNKKEIKETEEKLAKIDAEELELNLKEALQDSKIEVKRTATGDNGEELSLETVVTGGKGLTYDSDYLEPLNDYIVAMYVMFKDDNMSPAMVLPCCRVEEDSEGNFKSITYIYSEDKEAVEYIVTKTIKEVFKEEYDIDLDKVDKSFFTEPKKSDLVIVKDEDYVPEYIISMIVGGTLDDYKEPKLKTVTFGIDI